MSQQTVTWWQGAPLPDPFAPRTAFLYGPRRALPVFLSISGQRWWTQKRDKMNLGPELLGSSGHFTLPRLSPPHLATRASTICPLQGAKGPVMRPLVLLCLTWARLRTMHLLV